MVSSLAVNPSPRPVMLAGIVATCAVAFLLVGTGMARAQSLPVIRLSAGMHVIRAEVAATVEARSRGLMFRESLEPNQGMVFVFDEAAAHCMWMRNTLIPLAVAFLDGQGRIINVEEMQPQTEDNHCAAQPARYALEMNSGWFRQRGIGTGTEIRGIVRDDAAR